MKRWWLTVLLAAVAVGLSVYLVFRPDPAARLVAAYGRDQALGPRVVELGSDAVAPLCEALEGLPVANLSEADRQAMVNYVVALHAISGGLPYTAHQSIPVILGVLGRLEDARARDLLMETIGRSFKQAAAPAMLDVLEDEFRMSKPGGPAALPSEPVVTELMKRLGAGRCLPVLAARLEAVKTDFRKTLVHLVCAFAPHEQAGRILARALEQETDAGRRAYLADMIEGLQKPHGASDGAPPRSTP